MSTVLWCDPEAWRFKTISELKESMRYGAEVVIEWKGIEYGIWSESGGIRITTDHAPEQVFHSVDDALEYRVGGDRLRDIITEVEVTERTI